MKNGSDNQISFCEIKSVFLKIRTRILLVFFAVLVISALIFILLPKKYQSGAILELGSYPNKNSILYLGSAKEIALDISLSQKTRNNSQTGKNSFYIKRVRRLGTSDRLIEVVVEAASQKDAVKAIESLLNPIIVKHKRMINSIKSAEVRNYDEFQKYHKLYGDLGNAGMREQSQNLQAMILLAEKRNSLANILQEENWLETTWKLNLERQGISSPKAPPFFALACALAFAVSAMWFVFYVVSIPASSNAKETSSIRNHTLGKAL